MEIRNVEECLRFRLLRRIRPDPEKTKKSLELSRKKMSGAKSALKLGIFEFAVLESYMAMFHSARAMLYRDGIQEKSHYALFVYLKEKYSQKIPIHIINLINIHRKERHEAMYGLEYEPDKTDAVTAIEDAELFVKEIEANLKS